MAQQYASIKSIDAITGLESNDAFLELLCHVTDAKMPCEVMLLGIDNFKAINNLYSYAFGNLVLQYFTKEVQSVLPPSAKLFRLDGDRFGIIYLDGLHGECEKIFEKVSKQSPHIEDDSIFFTVSAGICYCPEYGEDGNSLYMNASLALEHAKIGAKNALKYYTPAISQQVKKRMFLLERLRKSIANDFEFFTLYYQPIIDNSEKSIYGCEALLRFKDDAFAKEVSPMEFIPLLESSGMIVDVGKWVVKTALAQCAKWQKVKPNFHMSINVSACQLDDSSFFDYILDEISKYNIPPNTVILELTESEQTTLKKIRNFFDSMRKQGIQTAFDDFGTGYASLDIFRQVSVDKLKIDRSFLERITDNIADQTLLKSILDMCKKMNILVCIEGIETQEMEHIVSQMNPHLLQGYKYSRPIPATDFETRYFQETVSEKHLEHIEDSPFAFTEHRPAQPMTLSEIVNNSYSGIFQVGMDKEFTFLTCNEGYRRMLGYTAREMEEKFGNKALGFVHPDDVEWVSQEIISQLMQGDTVNIEFRVVRADGRAIWILGTGNLVRTTEGNPSLIVNIIENDRRKQKNLRNESKLELYEKILTLLPTGIKYIRFDPCFTIEYISPGFLSILGYTEQEVFELFDGKYINFVHPDDREKTTSDVLEQLEKGDVVHLHYRAICKDGSAVWMDTISRLLPTDDDGIQRWCSSVVNVTDTITEEEMNRSLNIQSRLHKASDLWGEVVFEYYFASKQLFVSESFTNMFGYSIPENGMIDPELIFGENTADFAQLLTQTSEDEAPAPLEIPVLRADGSTLWCRVFTSNSEQIGGESVSVIGKIYDIDAEYTERERLRIASQTDSLTGLYNKGFSEQSVTALLEQAPEALYSCWLIDVDDFKIINDTVGHLAGDTVLVEISNRLRNFFHENTVIGRIGGDEFLVFDTHETLDEKTLVKTGNDLLSILQETVVLEQGEIIPKVSIGVSCYPKDGKKFNELYQSADKALYRAKDLGKSNVCFN